MRSVRGFARHFGRFKCAVPGASRTRAQLLASDSGPRALGSGVCARCVEQHEQQNSASPSHKRIGNVLGNNQPAESWPCEAELGGARFFIDIVSQSLLFNSLIAASVHSNFQPTHHAAVSRDSACQRPHRKIKNEKRTARCHQVDRMPSRRPSSVLSSRSAVGLYPALENVNRSAAAELLYPASVSASAGAFPAVAPRAVHAATSHSHHVSEDRHVHSP